MKKIILPLLAASLTLLLGCSSLQVRINQAEDTDMSQYKSFNFDPTPDSKMDPVLFSDINQKYIRNAITKELRAKGYTKSKKPDLLISLYLKVENKQDLVRTPGDYGRSRYYGGYGYYGYYSGYRYDDLPAYTVDYTIGTLIIDLVDMQKIELVWQGVAAKVLSDSQQNPQKEIESVIQKVFKKYPSAAGSTQTP